MEEVGRGVELLERERGKEEGGTTLASMSASCMLRIINTVSDLHGTKVISKSEKGEVGMGKSVMRGEGSELCRLSTNSIYLVFTELITVITMSITRIITTRNHF